jgi:glycosyl hydrolase family 25
VTQLLADIASYQGSLTLAQLKKAGYSIISVKVSHGLTQRSVHDKAAQYVKDARAGGWGLASFHFLDGTASGRKQAGYAYDRMKALGLHVNAAHIVDVENSSTGNATEKIYQDYCLWMRQLLGRDFITYTGDWWWEPRGFRPATRWLMGAPAAGYLPAYPGDTSPHWKGYGGWDELAIMQYRATGYPIAGHEVSQSAIRSPALWAQMIGKSGENAVASWTVVPCLLTLRDEFNRLSPNRDKGSDGTIGDTAHTSSSDHTPDEDSSVLRDHDADEKNEVHALDTDSSGPWPGTGTQKQRYHSRVMAIIAGEKAKWLDPNDRCRLNYAIWDGKIYDKDNDFEPRTYTGSDQHTGHGHFSARYETSCENDTRPWGVIPLADQEEDIVTTQAEFNGLMHNFLRTDQGRTDVAWAILAYDPNADASGDTPNGSVKNLTNPSKGNETVGAATALERAQVAAQVAYQVRDRVDEVKVELETVKSSLTQILAAVTPQPEQS